MTDSNKEKKLSIRAYALTLHVDEKTVRKARDAGLLKDGYDEETGKIIPSKADAAWGYRQKVVKPKGGVSRAKAIEKLTPKDLFKEFDNGDADDFEAALEQQLLGEQVLDTNALLKSINVTSTLNAAEAMRRREIIALALDKKKLEEAEGVLVRKEKVEKVLFALGSELKKGLLDVPARCARDVMAATTEVEAMKILTDELIAVLQAFSSLKSLPSA